MQQAAMGGLVVEEEQPLKKEEIADLKDEVVVEDVKVDQRDEDDDDHEDDENDGGTLASSGRVKQSRNEKKSSKSMSKLRMKPVTGVRRVTIKKAKNMKKKAFELGTSHNVPICVIIYPGPNSKAETYPENQDEVRAVIDRYMSIPVEERCENLQEDEKRRKLKNLESKANSVLDKYSREELAELASYLDYKIQSVDERIRFLKTQRLDASFPENAEFPCENAVLDVESKLAIGVLASDRSPLPFRYVDISIWLQHASLPENAEFPCENAVLDVESKLAIGVLASD